MTDAVIDYAVARLALDPPPLDRPRTSEELACLAGPTVTKEGLGGDEALRVFAEVLAPACISVDHPRFLSFIPAAPTRASVLFDLAVSASGIYGGSWMEGAGAVYAENEALRWIADLAGLPETAGGVFVAGGSAGNLSALLAARWRWRQRAGGRHDRTRGLIVTSSGSHPSIVLAARAMDADIVSVPATDHDRMWGSALAATVGGLGDDAERLFAIVATAGTTNAGTVDDLAGAAEVARELDCWFHVDGAYGGAAMCAPSARWRFAGVEQADSFIVDPHKWLFGPFDSCALLYRDPEVGRAAHTQHAEYLDVLHAERNGHPDWNPSDYAHHLTRRARGLPLWFSLAAHGTEAYAEAMEQTLRVARSGAELVRSAPHLELLLEPELSVVVFRRTGWGAPDYDAWCQRMLDLGSAFAVPTQWRGETVMRWCVVNPETTVDDLALLVDTMA